MALTPPPIEEAFAQSDKVSDVTPSTKERVLGAMFSRKDPATGEPGPMDQALAKEHGRRLDEAKMHQRNMSTAAAKIHYDDQMREKAKSDPTAAQGYTFLTPEQRQSLMNEYEASKAHFTKAAGVNKETKGVIGKITMLLDHVMGRGQAQPDGGQQPKQGGGPTPPPPMATVMESGVTPPSSASGQEGEQRLPFSATAPFERADIIRQQNLKDYADKEKVLYDLKTKEDEAKAKAQAEAKKATTGSARPATIAAISARKAKILMQSGKKYKDIEGNDINVAELPDEMGLKSFTVKLPDGSWDIRYEPFSPNQKVVTAGNQTWTINPMDVEGLASDEGTALGEHNVPSTTATRDPATGQTTVAQRTPAMPGIAGRSGAATPQGAAVPATPAAPAARKPSPPPMGAAVAGTGGKSTPIAKQAQYLDDDGAHINANAVGKPWRGGVLTPQVIEAANQLIDDRDVDKMPTKVRELGAALAREKAGWFQGKWTPQDESRMLQAKTFLERLRDSDALKVLDSSAWNRFWVGKAGEPRHKGAGLLGAPSADVENFVIAQSAKGLKPEEAEFNRLFNQASGTVAGLSTLTRAGRATNAQVDTIRTELPNVFNAKDSKDAKARINNLLKEIENAHQIGIHGKGKGQTPPPGASTSSIDDEIMNAVKAAKPH